MSYSTLNARVLVTVTGALAGLLALAISSASASSHGPAGRGSRSSTRVVIHVALSGGYRYTGTFLGYAAAPNTGCMLDRSTHTYAVRFNASGMLAPKGSLPVFTLGLDSYRPNVQRYNDPHRTLLSVKVQGHAFGMRLIPFDRNLSVMLRVTPGGKSGRFTVRHLVPLSRRGAPNGTPVNVSGSWSCTALQPM